MSNALASKFGFVQLSFAGALKEDIVDMGFDREDVYVRKPEWMRKLLQAYGQARRAQDPDYWLNRVKAAVSLCKPNTVFIIDDVRFLNEATWVEENGVLIRIEREDYMYTDSDQSEIALDGWPFTHVVHGLGGEIDDLVEHVEDCLWYEGRK